MSINKIVVSSAWFRDERVKVAKLIQAEITRLEEEEKEMRKTVLWEAPCFAENQVKRDGLAELKSFVQHAIQKFLENNRHHFSDFIQ